MPDWFATNELTVALSIILVGTFVIATVLRPQSLVHPILLGRQSDVERVRRKGESAVYRNYGTGMMGRLPARPAREVQLISDLVKADFRERRNLWGVEITNDEIKTRASNLGAGLIRKAGLVPRESNVLLLLNDSIDFVVADLALATYSVPSFTLSDLRALVEVLEKHPPDMIIVHSQFLGQLLEVLADNNDTANQVVVVVGEITSKAAASMRGQITFLDLKALEEEGAKVGSVECAAPHPNDVFTVTSFLGPNGDLKSVEFTHENITAGVTAVRLLVPLTSPLSPTDTVISTHSLSTPYGRAIAYAAIYDGCHFSTTHSTAVYGGASECTLDATDVLAYKALGVPSPTVLFLTAHHVNSITSAILAKSKQSSPLFFLAWRHKLAALQEGFLSKISFWDKLTFAGARRAVLHDVEQTLKAVIAGEGALDTSALTPTRLAFSVPFVNAYTSPLVPGPIFASHSLDLQSFGPTATTGSLAVYSKLAHVGPPSINVEVKLVGLDDGAVEAGSNPEGALWIRGPAVGNFVGRQSDLPDKWVAIGERAMVQNNGTFKVTHQNQFKE